MKRLRNTISGCLLAGFLSVFMSSAYAEAMLNIEVQKSGIYRLTHAQLSAAGLDLSGVSLDRIGLKNDGEFVPVRFMNVDTDNAVFTTNSSIEYIGEDASTLYQTGNVYTLTLDEGQRLIIEDNRVIDETVGPAYSYLETVEYAPQNHYSSMTPDSTDAWYADRLKATKEAVSKSISLIVENYAPSLNVGFGGNFGGPSPVQMADVLPSVGARVWGASSLPGNGVQKPDHDVQLLLNGSEVTREQFDGLKLHQMSKPLAELKDGTHNIDVRLPFTHGYGFDIVDIDRVWLKYPRRFVAKENGHALHFPSKWKKFRVRGLAESDAYRVYRKTPNGDVYEMKQLQISCENAQCGIIFAGEQSDQDSEYFVATTENVISNEQIIKVAPITRDILSGNSEYLLISHEDFINTSSGALEYLKRQLLEKYDSVDIVSVEQIYAKYSGHKMSAVAIYDYLKDAYSQRGTRYVTLVGDDNYDYQNRLSKQAKSFIPTLYVALGHNMNFVPSDAKFADVVGNDDIPDIPISRLPVRTENELLRLINKRYQYLISQDSSQIVFSADTVDGNNYNFKSKLEDVVNAGLFTGFSHKKYYLDDVDAKTAKSQLINTINQGVSLVTYFGHSSVDRWSFSDLLSSEDISKMNNTDSPFIVTQLGCWNNYYVDPKSDSIGMRLLLQNDGGAVTVLGATTLTQAETENRLARLLLPNLSEGKSVGDALLAAKQSMAETDSSQKDILLGWAVLGFLDLQVVK